MKDQAKLPLRAVKDPLVGTTVDGRFNILAAIGLGVTSSVYKAEEVVSGRLVAIKILHPHLAADENLVSRFEREAQAAKILRHSNIVPVSEYAVSDKGTPYLVMEYVDGISLQQLLAKDGWLSVPTAIAIFTQICAGLNEAHQKDVVHRDIKPGNIMLVDRPDGQYLVKILDFGCAQMMPLLGDTVLKLTQTGEMLGSLLYMSPEQCLDGDVDGRSDCYSLGCVLYESLTGKPPLAARTAFETMNKQLSEMPDTLQHARPDLVFSKELEKVIFKAVAKSPAKRYQKITDFMDALIKCSHERSSADEEARHQALHKFEGSAGIDTEGAAAILKHSNAGNVITAFEKQGDLDKAEHFDSQRKAPEGPLKTSTKIVAVVALSTLVGGWLFVSLVGALGPVLYFCLYFVLIGTALFVVGKFSREEKPLEVITRRDAQMINLNERSSTQDPALRIDSSSPFIPALETAFEVTVLSAERRGDLSIALEIKVESQPRQRISVRPLESRTLFWQTLCDDGPNAKRQIELPVKGSIRTIDKTGAPYIEIEKHLALILT